MNLVETKDFVIKELDQHKAFDIKAIETDKLNDFIDWMIFATGSSSRHIKSLTDNLNVKFKQQNVEVFGVEGKDNAKWALIDLGDIIVHIMLAEVREFYQLEKLWSTELAKPNIV